MSSILIMYYQSQSRAYCLFWNTYHSYKVVSDILPTKSFTYTHHSALSIISRTSQNSLLLLRLTSCNTHGFPYVPVKLCFLTFYFEDSEVRSAVKSPQCVASTVHPKTLEDPGCSDNRWCSTGDFPLIWCSSSNSSSQSTETKYESYNLYSQHVSL